MYEFPCPHCSTPLRLRDDRLSGQAIPCPDCRQPVSIESTGDGLRGVPLTVETLRSQGKSFKPESWPRWIGIGVAVLLLLGGGLFLWMTSGDDSAQVSGSLTSAQAVPEAVGPPDSEEPDAGEAPAGPGEAELPPQGESQHSSVADRLREIHLLMAKTHLNAGRFPSGQARQQERQVAFSWVAELALEALPAAPVDWSRRWHDSTNDEFIRRRFALFLNPRIDEKLNDQGLPVSHFVGISGVGPDAAELPIPHPRAGIFGSSRRTRIDDVTDGLSQTLLVAGVRSQLGSWAEPGRATMRSFSAEPYLNGPDGFGTGETGGMSVLMADGSVRMLNETIDPLIIRRMAAMADGFSLDPSEPGDPLTAHLAEQETPLEPASPPSPEIPMFNDPSPEPLPPPRDIGQQLAMPVVAFTLVRPAPLEQVLIELQELSGVVFDWSRLTEEQRQTPVSLDLREISLREILEAVISQAGLTLRIDGNSVAIEPGNP